MTESLATIRRQVASRLKELEPLVAEYRQLEQALAALDQAGAPPARRRRAAGGAGTGRRGRPRGSGTRGAQALAIVQAHPGITIPELAAEMGIKQNYLYRVMPGLEADGKVRKDDRGWHPVDAAA